MRINALKTKVMSALEVVRRKRQVNEEIRGRINRIRSAIAYLHPVPNIVTHNGQSTPCSGAIDSALRLRNVVSASSRRKDAGGL